MYYNEEARFFFSLDFCCCFSKILPFSLILSLILWGNPAWPCSLLIYQSPLTFVFSSFLSLLQLNKANPNSIISRLLLSPFLDMQMHLPDLPSTARQMGVPFTLESQDSQ